MPTLGYIIDAIAVLVCLLPLTHDGARILGGSWALFGAYMIAVSCLAAAGAMLTECLQACGDGGAR